MSESWSDWVRSNGNLTEAGLAEAERRSASLRVRQRVVIVRAIGDYAVGTIVIVHGRGGRTVDVKPPRLRGHVATINVLHVMPLEEPPCAT